MPTYKIILNPAAGRGAGARTRPTLEKILHQAGVSYEITETHGPRDATQLAREMALGTDGVLVVVGGDGTAHEAVNGLVQRARARGDWADGKPVGPLGLVPIGTGDDLAWGLGFRENDLEAVCRILLADRRRIVDLGEVTDDRGQTEIFHNHLGGAFEGEALIESLKLRHMPRMMLYPAALARILPRYNDPVPMTIRYKDVVLTRPMLEVATANGGRTGGTFKIAPDARPDDGELDLVLAHAPSIARILWLVLHFMRGTHTKLTDYVVMDRVLHVVVEAPGGIPVHLDGEIYNPSARRFDVTVLPGRLQVVSVPKKA